MQPQQPGMFISPSTPQPSQYDFIVNAGNNRGGPDWLTTASLKTRIIIVGGGFLTLLLVAWIFIALVSGSGNSSIQQLVTLAQEQTELVRIADIANRDASQATTQNFAMTTRLSLASDTQALMTYLKTYNAVPSNDTLAKGKNTHTDASLKAAQSAGSFDSTFLSIAGQQLTTYMQNTKQTFNSISDSKERFLLSTMYDHAQLLLTQSQQAN